MKNDDDDDEVIIMTISFLYWDKSEFVLKKNP